MSAIKTDDIISTLQQLNLIQYIKGQHVVYAHPKMVEKCLKQVGGKPPEPELAPRIFAVS
jgi:histone acetyltransferase MYST1